MIEKLSTKIDNLTLKVQDEFLANQMASKADFGWRMVKFFESDSLFKGDDAEAMNKKS